MLRAFVEIVGEIPFPFDVLENMDLGTQEALDDYAPMVTQAYKIYCKDGGEEKPIHRWLRSKRYLKRWASKRRL